MFFLICKVLQEIIFYSLLFIVLATAQRSSHVSPDTSVLPKHYMLNCEKSKGLDLPTANPAKAKPTPFYTIVVGETGTHNTNAGKLTKSSPEGEGFYPDLV